MKLRYNIEDDFVNYISSTDSIFHYTRRTIALEKILYENRFKFSSFNNTNDPYEYKVKLTGAVGWGWDNPIEAKIHETEKILEKILTEQTLFISCCSNEFENDSLINHGFLKSRMWSQYSESHERVCLSFSKKKLSELLAKKFPSTEFILWEGDVEYKEYVNEHSHHDSLHVNGSDFDHNTPNPSSPKLIWPGLIFSQVEHFIIFNRLILLHLNFRVANVVTHRTSFCLTPAAQADMQ